MAVTGSAHSWSVFGGDPPFGRSSRVSWACSSTVDTQEEHVKSAEEIMKILEAFDLTRSCRDAGELAGCSPNTVAHWVARRDGRVAEVSPDSITEVPHP